jgi:hypothetical protein
MSFHTSSVSFAVCPIAASTMGMSNLVQLERKPRNEDTHNAVRWQPDTSFSTGMSMQN